MSATISWPAQHTESISVSAEQYLRTRDNVKASAVRIEFREAVGVADAASDDLSEDLASLRLLQVFGDLLEVAAFGLERPGSILTASAWAWAIVQATDL